MRDVAVTVNEDAGRFEATVDGIMAFLKFVRSGDRITLVHTEVPSSLEGRGVGGAIVRAALQYARDNELVVVPRCPFVASYLIRHPEEAAQLKLDADG